MGSDQQEIKYHRYDYGEGNFILDENGEPIPKTICICFARDYNECVCGAWFYSEED